MSETPEDATPVTDIEESDPNADSPEGVAGDMGVSSERKGPVRGHDQEVTYGSAPTHLDDDPAPDDAPPEQSARDGRPEVNPESPGPHVSDPSSNPRHGV
jgi:hypothetical protein